MTAHTICGACRANNHIKEHMFHDGCKCACHLDAWVKAERDTWAWTNADRTEARKGRWLAESENGDWCMSHDEVSDALFYANGWSQPNVTGPRAAIARDFLAWHANQTPPPPAWHTPEPGSLWELTVDGHTGDWVALARRNGVVFCRVETDGLISPEFYGVTAGREVTR